MQTCSGTGEKPQQLPCAQQAQLLFPFVVYSNPVRYIYECIIANCKGRVSLFLVCTVLSGWMWCWCLCCFGHFWSVPLHILSPGNLVSIRCSCWNSSGPLKLVCQEYWIMSCPAAPYTICLCRTAIWFSPLTAHEEQQGGVTRVFGRDKKAFPTCWKAHRLLLILLPGTLGIRRWGI